MSESDEERFHRIVREYRERNPEPPLPPTIGQVLKELMPTLLNTADNDGNSQERVA